MYIAMEYLQGGSLKELIHKAHEKGGTKLKDMDVSRIIKGVLSAVAYLHGFDIAHRDLKPGIFYYFAYEMKENIMFEKKNDMTSLKLIDFGLSAKYAKTEAITLTDKCGTAIYMAPEVFANYQYSKVFLSTNNNNKVC